MPDIWLYAGEAPPADLELRDPTILDVDTAGITVTPGTVALVLAEFAPTISLPLQVTPATASLVLTEFAPTIALPLKVTPGTRALVLTEFAPAVQLPFKVTPAARELILTGYAPAVQSPLKVTPGVRALTLATFAPTITIGSPNLVATPATVALVLRGFAPAITIAASANVVITPDTAPLVLTGMVPDVSGDHHGSGFGHVVADTGRNLRYEFAETEIPEPVLVSPAPLRLKLTTFAPIIVKGSSVAFGLDELAALTSELDADELAVLIAA